MRRHGLVHLAVACAAVVALLVNGGFRLGRIDAATNWDTVVTPVAPRYLSLRTGPPFADGNGLATVAPAGLVPTPSTSSDFGDWEARYNYYPATRLLPCDGGTFNSAAGCDGVNPQGHDLSTLTAWQARFGFPPRQSGESLADYRKRNRIAIYYNENELGLGRELGCSTFTDYDNQGKPIATPGLACFVTNYGEAINDRKGALEDAVEGRRVRNTLVISYQPSLPSGYGVNFGAYDGQGRTADTATLDYMGERPLPGICMNCHGGTYDASKHLVQGARFLPVNVLEVKYPDAVPYTKADQNETFRSGHDLIYRTDGTAGGGVLLTPAQREWLRALYGVRDPGAATIPPGSPAGPAGIPSGWVRAGDIYRYVISPYCAGCHNALSETNNPVASWKGFKMKWDSQKATIDNFSMPHSQATLAKFWGAHLTDDGSAGGRAVLVAKDGSAWKSARNFLVSSMEHGPELNPAYPGPGCTDHAQCGDVTDSGRMCVNGSCQDGCGDEVGCPGSTGRAELNVQECRRTSSGTGLCVSCGRIGQPPCAGGVCNEGTNVNGVCL